MVAAANLVEVAALVGDTARATMLAALMGGQALTATELAYCANISRSTASGHLGKLVAARLLTVTRKRRFSYYRIASPLVARMLESIKLVAAIEVPPRHRPRSADDEALRFARSCYDHLAGQAGVAITDALMAMDHLVLTDEGGELTSSGERFLCTFGADLMRRPASRRVFCQPCLDWTERRFHLKGVVGAAILHRLLQLGWFERVSDSRALDSHHLAGRGWRKFSTSSSTISAEPAAGSTSHPGRQSERAKSHRGARTEGRLWRFRRRARNAHGKEPLTGWQRCRRSALRGYASGAGRCPVFDPRRASCRQTTPLFAHRFVCLPEGHQTTIPWPMALHAKRRLSCFLIAMLFAIGGVGQVYAATQALVKMPAAAMEGSSQDHGMDCGGKDKGSRAACVALCATSVAILVDSIPVSSAAAQCGVEATTETPPPSRNLSPEPPPPKR